MKKTLIKRSWINIYKDDKKQLKHVHKIFTNKFFKLIKEYKSLKNRDYLSNDMKYFMKVSFKERLSNYYKSISILNYLIYNGYDEFQINRIYYLSNHHIIESYLR